MSKKDKKWFSDLSGICLKFLDILSYRIADENKTPSIASLLWTVALPLGCAGFSFWLLEISTVAFWATVVGLLYKVTVAWNCNATYRAKFYRIHHTAVAFPETPIKVRLIVLLVTIIFITLMYIVHIFKSDVVSAAAMYLIAGVGSIFLSWFLDTVDALVALYDAQYPEPHTSN